MLSFFKYLRSIFFGFPERRYYSERFEEVSKMAENDHPYIIKMPVEQPVCEYGLGYELFEAMKKYPSNIAQYVIDPEESQTYAELLENCIKVALNLKKENISEEDIVCLCVGNHLHACVPYIAALFLGHKVTAIDPVLLPDEKAKMLEKVTPKIIFVDQKSLQNIEESLKIAKLNIKLVVIGDNTNGHSSFSEFLVAPEKDIQSFEPVKLSSNKGTAVIFFSSGTSGTPKGICISHYALLCRTRGINLPIMMIFAQLNWISYALMLFHSLRSGTARVLTDNFEIESVWIIIAKYKINLVFARIFQITEFAKLSKPQDIDTSCLKVLMSSGSALPPNVFLKLKELLPEVVIFQSYGLTEITGPALVFNLGLPEHREWQVKKPKSCGTPIPGIWYKIVDPETEEILGPNKPGELRMKSKLAMVGYHNMDSSDDFDSDGWLKTGDILQYDEDQCFFVVDRIKEMIKYRSWIISPAAIEQVLLTHPAVEMAAVVGIPQEGQSDFPMGIVTIKDNCEVEAKELEKYVEERVLDRERLRAGVKIIREMPLNSSGKIQKRMIRRMVLDGEL